MTRHRQKDEEAGAEGFGILNTRKRMWKDAEGNIVTKKPKLHAQSPSLQTQADNSLFAQPFPDLLDIEHQQHSAPISPPISLSASHSRSWSDHDVRLRVNYLTTNVYSDDLANTQNHSTSDPQFWTTELGTPQLDSFASTALNDVLFDDIFNPDTASSFNNPFTTGNNYSWLFDMDIAKVDQGQQPVALGSDSVLPLANNHSAHNRDELEFDPVHPTYRKSSSTIANITPAPSRRMDSVQFDSSPGSLITPPSNGEEQRPDENTETGPSHAPSTPARRPSHVSVPSNNLGIERPLSMLQPSARLPVIDEIARQEFLRLIDTTQPTITDGSIVMRDHPLLSLRCLQTYCDLFFTRFNTAYPLMHMSTFDPSKVDTLLLTSVLLLGATYGEKDAHQLAVSRQILC